MDYDTLHIHLSLRFHVNSKDKSRVCKVGAGKEKTKGAADTPGFTLVDDPVIKFDHRSSQKLHMPRNHARVHQSSLNLLQSWRGNCDIQILVYNCNPKYPSMSEIARVTDYVVAYSCKGNTTIREEREQNKHLILA